LKSKLIIKYPSSQENKIIHYYHILHIPIHKIRYTSQFIYITISKNDYSKIKSYQEPVIYKDYSFLGLISYLNKEKGYFLTLLIFTILTFFYTRIISVITIRTEDNLLRETISEELEELGLKKFSFVKNTTELENIKDLIMQQEKDTIEWLNIERVGMKYIVNIVPKTTKNKNNQSSYCQVVATKDAIISKIVARRGVELVDINDYVKKGDILISGDITYNSEIKAQVCADGEVYGKNWYQISITIPKTQEVKIKKEKYRYNLKIKYHNRSHIIFNYRISNPLLEEKKIISFFGIDIYLLKEYENYTTTTEYTTEELENMANAMAMERLSLITDNDFKIITQKVLKKVINDSTIDIDMFIVCEEKISQIT